jgi:hypothetical protein
MLFLSYKCFLKVLSFKEHIALGTKYFYLSTVQMTYTSHLRSPLSLDPYKFQFYNNLILNKFYSTF